MGDCPVPASEFLDTMRPLSPFLPGVPGFSIHPQWQLGAITLTCRGTPMLGPRAGRGVGGGGWGSLTPTLAPTDGSMPHSISKHSLDTC